MKKVLKDTKTLLFENMVKLNPDFKLTEGISETYGVPDPFGTNKAKPVNEDDKWIQDDVKLYQIKTEKLKAFMDELIKMQEFDVIDTLYRLLIERKHKTIGSLVNEIKLVEGQQNDTYFETLSDAINAVREKVAKKGFTLDEDEVWTYFGTGGVSYGQTKRANIPLLKDGIPDKRRSVMIILYRMESGTYELTSYIN